MGMMRSIERVFNNGMCVILMDCVVQPYCEGFYVLIFLIFYGCVYRCILCIYSVGLREACFMDGCVAVCVAVCVAACADAWFGGCGTGWCGLWRCGLGG